jgi:fructuronate reductase
MLQLNIKDINSPSKRAEWEASGVALPSHDIGPVALRTSRSPRWLHLGAGNIFRGFVARLQQQLLDSGDANVGVIVAEAFDYDIIDRVFAPYDNMSLSVGLLPDGGVKLNIVASITEAIRTDIGMNRLKEIFCSPTLQMVSLTIADEGYAITDTNGELTRTVRDALSSGPENAVHPTALITSLLYERFGAGRSPIAIVSLDDLGGNGALLRSAVLKIAGEWLAGDFVDEDFIEYVENEDLVSFPCSMIDKITPSPSESVCEMLTNRGIVDMAPQITSRGTFIAPFVNTEIPQYLVVEDRFPAGRLPLERAGVYFADRRAVDRAYLVKATACLDPLYTALALFGCLLGFADTASAIGDPLLGALAERIGGTEGLPAAEDPGIFSPEEFLREAISDRLPNRFTAESTHLIAADTSRKLSIRFGRTIRTYMERPGLDTASLIGIPLAIAAWFRYLLGTDDALERMHVSGDPMLPEITEAVRGVRVGEPGSYRGQLRPFLSNPALFAVDLYEAKLGDRVESLFVEMLGGAGAVRRTLRNNLEK